MDVSTYLVQSFAENPVYPSGKENIMYSRKTKQFSSRVTHLQLLLFEIRRIVLQYMHTQRD